MTENIHYLSLVKLAEYSQTRTDVPIRKYVLISNMLRQQDTHPSELDDGSEVSHKDDVLEQQWFDTCLDALHTEE
ncbi:uncharacterized protein BYT42DRAFT_469884, partial [Radiomyces spectabilis]|uniref:uncharacterized protein n=1 Tax=Radiomyces spectabilis TaxID=64574 RepID=UPI0022208A25